MPDSEAHDAEPWNADRSVLERLPTWTRLFWLGAWMQLPATLLPIWRVAGRGALFRLDGAASGDDPRFAVPWFSFVGPEGMTLALGATVVVLAAFAASLSLHPGRRRAGQLFLVAWGLLWAGTAAAFTAAGGATWPAVLHPLLTACAAVRAVATWRVRPGSGSST